MFLFIVSNLYFLNYGESLFKIAKQPEIILKPSITCPIVTSLKNENPSFSNIVSCDFSGLYLDSGFALSTNYTDSVMTFAVFPIKTDFFNWKFYTRYHLYDFFSSFIEQDFVNATAFSFLFGNKVRVELGTGNILKLTNFKNKNIEGPLFNSSWFINLLGEWNINQLITIFFELTSFDYFDYQLLGSPFFKIGGKINCTEKVSVCTDYMFKVTDMIAVSPSIFEMLLTLYLRIKL